MEVPPNTLMPDILLWNDRVEKKSKHNRVVEEIEKVFTLQAFKKKKKAHRENTLEGDEDLQEALNEFYKPQTTEKFKKQETKNKQNLDDVADESPHRLPTLGLRGDQREGTDAHEG